MREEQVRAARSALRRARDISGRNTCRNQLTAIGLDEIQEDLVRRDRERGP